MRISADSGTNRLIFCSGRQLRWRRVRIPLIMSALFILAATVFHYEGLMYNNSPSEPVGFYWLKSALTVRDIQRGDRVSFCPPVKRANYPFLEQGSCSGGTVPFFKTVVGIAGDVVEVSANSVSVNGRVLADSASMSRSVRLGVAMPHAYGIWKLRAGQYWVYGSGMPKYSFDSRYWGPLVDIEIGGIAQFSSKIAPNQNVSAATKNARLNRKLK